MIRQFVSFALHQPLFVALLAALFVAGGVAAFKSLPVEAFPDVSDIQVTVVTLYPGRAPEEVEKQVTIPLEVALAGLPHSVRLFSHTQFGLSYIIITFDDRVDDYFARQRVLDRLQGVDLPPGVQPQLAPLSTAIGEIYRFRLKGAGYSPTELRSIEDWVVERQFRITPGVADVVSLGGFVKQYEVNPDLAKMRSLNLTLPQLLTALSRGNANAGGGYVEGGAQQFIIRGIGLLRSQEEIGAIVVAERNGTPILVRDVAEVRVGSVPRQGIAGQDESDEIVTGIVVMRKGENPSEVLAALKDRVDKLNRSILPRGVEIVPYYDRTWLIETTLKTVFKNLIEGAALVTLVLVLFLGNFRAAGIVALMIPLSLLATFVGLTLRGIPANLLSLGAMDFGIIVDGAVIVVENVFRRLSERATEQDVARTRETVLDAAAEVGRPTLFAMIIIIAAHIPIFTLQRHEGRIFAPMAWTITSALAGSLLFSLTLVPVMCLFVLGRNLPHGENGLVRRLKRTYEPALVWALDRRWLVLGCAVAALVASLAAVTRLGTEFLPELNEGTLWVNVNLPAGLSLSEATAQCAKIRAALRKFPEVRTVISKSGRPEDGMDPKTLNMAEFFVDVKPPWEWNRSITKDQLIVEMDRELAKIPGIEQSFSQPIRDNVFESISQIDGQIVVKLFGDDPDVLAQKAENLLAIISAVRGVARSFIDRAGDAPQIQIQIDRARAARYGLNVSDIQDVIETALGGKSVTEIWEGERHFGVAVRLTEPERTLTAMRRILVDTPDGFHVPLEEIATFTAGSGDMNISREFGVRLKAIAVFIRDRDMGSIVEEMKQKVKAIALPPGYYITWSGEFENQQRAMKRLSIILPVSILLIFLLLFNAFKSVRSAVLILLNVPFAMIGGIFALLLTGIPLSVSAAVGFIALFGQAALNGVVMVSHFNQLREGGLSAREAIERGALVRFRTVMMTALLAMLGLLPMALSHGIGSETQRPLAVVIIGGLTSATLLTLIVLPTLSLMFEGGGGAKGASDSPPP